MKKSQKILSLSLALTVLFGQAMIKGHQIRSANLTEVSATLSTSRLSFVGKLDANNSVGSSLITIQTTPGSAPSTTSAQLAEGDVVLIGDGGTANTYTVASASSTPGLFTIKSPSFDSLQTGNADNNDWVISTQSASLTVRFNTVSSVPDGKFQILVPATANTGAGDDGIPDPDGFDFTASTPTVTCPGNTTGYTFAAGAAAAEDVTIGGSTYHSFTCEYTGTGASGTAFDGVTEDPIVISSLINPSPKNDHVEGYADTYRMLVRHLDTNDNEVDSTSVAVGVIEAVRVTASVPPQITFGIIGVGSGTTACGVSTDVSTTATTVPFGEVSITSFTNAAQALTVSTNAANGYVVTALANDEMGLGGQVCTGNETVDTNCIPDAQVASMTHTTSQDWTLTTEKGFAYSLNDAGGTTTAAFEYDESGRTYSAKHFADNEAGQAAQNLFSAAAPVENDNLYVCYRIVVGATQPAGNYENYVTYRATATF